MKIKTPLLVYVVILLAIAILSCNNNSSEKQSHEQPPSESTRQTHRGSAAVDKSNDTVLIMLLAKTLDKFVQLEYNDTQTGKTMSYNLFIPKGYDKNTRYPLVLFIANASTVTKATFAPLTQGYGGVIWASAKEQAKHPCFVLVPQYSAKAVDDEFNTSDEVEMTIRLLEQVDTEYNLDRNRLYTTGQSMGGMMSMYFNVAHPGLLAASIFVGYQWDASKIDGFADDKFFYIIAAGDEKAPKGMVALKTVPENAGAHISTAEWDAKLPQAEQDAEVHQLLAKGNNINFVVFTPGSVLPENGPGNEHMASFDYAYQLQGVRDWLFKQNK